VAAGDWLLSVIWSRDALGASLENKVVILLLACLRIGFQIMIVGVFISLSVLLLAFELAFLA